MSFQSSDKFSEPENVPNSLIDVAEHMTSLKFRVWEKMQSLVEYSECSVTTELDEFV